MANLILQTNGNLNSNQSLLDLVSGNNITLTNSGGNVIIAAASTSFQLLGNIFSNNALNFIPGTNIDYAVTGSNFTISSTLLAPTISVNGNLTSSQTGLNLVAGSNITLQNTSNGNVLITANFGTIIYPTVSFKTNGTLNLNQSNLNLIAGNNVTLSNTANGNVVINAVIPTGTLNTANPISEGLMGTINGINTSFTSNLIPNKSYPYSLYYNGQTLDAGYDFTVTGNVWTYQYIIPSGNDRQWVSYYNESTTSISNIGNLSLTNVTLSYIATGGGVPTINQRNIGLNGKASLQAGSNDTSGIINVTTGTGVPAGGPNLFTVFFQTPYTGNIQVFLQPMNYVTSFYSYYVSANATSFVVGASSVLGAMNDFAWGYLVIGQ